jgi:aryl-alcohol dehydrogenase-like predicted oxidoreductase
VTGTSRSGALEVWLSVLHQEPWQAVQAAARQGLGTIVKVPLESGWLSGRYDARSSFEDMRKRWSREDIVRRAALVDRARGLLPPRIGPILPSPAPLRVRDPSVLITHSAPH